MHHRILGAWKSTFHSPTRPTLPVAVTMATGTLTTLETLKFDNLVLRTLPIDSESRSYVRTVKGACFSLVKPTPVKNPVVVAYSSDALALLGLNEEEAERPEFAEYFSGNNILPGSETAAHCYCGHQFGYFSGQLGDGAAIYLGEILNSEEERWEIQLKGAGPTPYSRSADGRKVLRSTIREFLCSEAMHYLGIPTTRAGACVTSDSKVIRDIFYNGNNIQERCTIVLRIAPTFIRFGSFEIFKTTDQFTGRHGPSVGRKDILTQLLNYTMETFYPEIMVEGGDELIQRKAFYTEVVKRTAQMVALWQCVGFCHGVLNTDNMSILGLTIDYGPFGFLDRYDPDHICNASDDGGRYTFVKQPEICQWNLMKLAEALKPLVPLEETLPILKEVYPSVLSTTYINKMRLKLGLTRKETDTDSDLVKDLLSIMETTGTDFTNGFRSLSSLNPIDVDSIESLVKMLLTQGSSVEDLLKDCQGAIDQRNSHMFLALLRTNPEILNQLGKGAEAVQRVMARIQRAQELKEMDSSKKEETDCKAWTLWLQKYRERLFLEGIWTQELLEERVRIMNLNNPSFILRNYIAQKAIEKAETGDYSVVRTVLKLLKTPFENHSIDANVVEPKECSSQMSEGLTGFHRPPEWAHTLRVT